MRKIGTCEHRVSQRCVTLTRPQLCHLQDDSKLLFQVFSSTIWCALTLARAHCSRRFALEQQWFSCSHRLESNEIRHLLECIKKKRNKKNQQTNPITHVPLSTSESGMKKRINTKYRRNTYIIINELGWECVACARCHWYRIWNRIHGFAQRKWQTFIMQFSFAANTFFISSSNQVPHTRARCTEYPLRSAPKRRGKICFRTIKEEISL